MTTTASQALRQLVKQRFLPWAESRGFTPCRSAHPLFMVFRRMLGDRVQVFNLQWDKYGAPRFVVNFGEGPRDGVVLWGRHVPGEALEPQDCRDSGRLQRRRGHGLRGWFQLDKPIFEALWTMERRYSAAAVVDQLIATFPEVERWWDDRTPGPHLSLLPRDHWDLATAAKPSD